MDPRSVMVSCIMVASDEDRVVLRDADTVVVVSAKCGVDDRPSEVLGRLPGGVKKKEFGLGGREFGGG